MVWVHIHIWLEGEEKGRFEGLLIGNIEIGEALMVRVYSKWNADLIPIINYLVLQVHSC